MATSPRRRRLKKRNPVHGAKARALRATAGARHRTWLLRGARDEDHVLAAAIGAAVEPAVTGFQLEAGLREERLPFAGRDPGQRHRRGAAGPRTDRVSVRACSSQSARSSIPARAPASGRGSPRCRRASARRRRTRAARLAGASPWADWSAWLRAESSGRWRYERNGQRTAGFLPPGRRAGRGSRPAAGRCRPGGLRSATAGLDHSRRRVDPDHVCPGLGDRHGDPPGADAELDDGAAGLPGLGDVEADVLDDASAPGVVELRDRVVRAGAHPGLRATQTNSRLSSANGPRSKSP